ncbi:hypothetical protein F5X99DRAFT_432720 [Biscogniauxia marginata]|nr:hypothetical protein F5X99DRAFT_432720 [Biscogniauxia marginata]
MSCRCIASGTRKSFALINNFFKFIINLILCKSARPEHFYYTEAKREYYRLESRRGPLPEMFRRLNGSRRRGVIVRHLVKRRWEKLGVWNSEWGFAGRKVQPSDNFCRWTWWWQPEGWADDPYQTAREIIAPALRLRQNLRRGEYAPLIPRSRIGPDASAADAEAFLISRPWFVFQIELGEEQERYGRLSVADQRRYPHSVQGQVIQWWKERGDWRDEFNRTQMVTSWKWRHESPSPEPQDLTPIHNIKDSPLDATTEMEFTPSEIDELETIELPRSEQPEGFWVIEKEDVWPYFPGQMTDNEAEIRKSEKERIERLEKAKAEGFEPPVDPTIKFLLEKFFPGGEPIGLFGPPSAVEHEEARPEEREASGEPQYEPQQDTSWPPPRKAQGQDQPLLPPPRRSARIAGMKRTAEPLPLQTAPNKRLRGRAAPKTAAPASRETRRTKPRPVPAQGSAEGKTETRPRQREHPKKENGPSMRSTATREAKE